MSDPKVFIIESLEFDDERLNLCEGNFLSHILELERKKPRYVYIRTKKELRAVLEQFRESEYRYLHFSCHGNTQGIALTLDMIDRSELANLLNPYVGQRRVFFSTCKVVTRSLAEPLLKGSGCWSVIGPSTNIHFGQAAIFWAALYHLMFRGDAKSMKYSELKKYVTNLSALFEVEMKYFRWSEKNALQEVL